MNEKKTIPILKKISVTLICILGSMGVIYFYDLLKNFTNHKADSVLWAIFFGISFAYIINYELDIKSNSLFRKKTRPKVK
jgi:hypothetical protein